MIGLRLFLPESWTCDAARMDRAKVPAEARAYRTKPEIAQAEIDCSATIKVRVARRSG
jgi:SRSO17 transposase